MRLPSSTCDAVSDTGATDEDVWVNDNTALFVRILNHKTPTGFVEVSVHLDDVTRTNVQVEPEGEGRGRRREGER